MLISSWHDQGYQAVRRESDAGSRFVECLGLALEVPAEVLAPATGVAEVLGNAAQAAAQGGERVLDVGTGFGINGILAARQSCAVVAVDINEHAGAAARANLVRNGVGERFAAFYSVVFSAEGLRRKVVARTEKDEGGRRVGYLTYRLSR
ncbi:MAG TPA: 50S ribosomal protein L11 methyltransferase [Pseudonocardiaceae bacterium]|jgi:methylase of polypeptide subunit release factors|nr:50S ribosomal protein L11 methyltransferase [Pseudonocardiaceae bacterium]